MQANDQDAAVAQVAATAAAAAGAVGNIRRGCSARS